MVQPNLHQPSKANFKPDSPLPTGQSTALAWRENETINKLITTLVKPFDDPTLKKIKIKMQSTLISGEAIYLSKTSGLCVGHSKTVVLASLEDLAVRDRFMRRTIPTSFFLEDLILEAIHENHDVRYYALKFPPPMRDREFLTSSVQKQIDQDTIVVCNFPTIVKRHQTKDTKENRVRAEVHQFYQMKRIAEGVTRFDFYVKVDMRGKMPKFVINHILPVFMGFPLTRQSYFQHQRKLSILDADDGKRMGIMLSYKASSKVSERAKLRYKQLSFNSKKLNPLALQRRNRQKS